MNYINVALIANTPKAVLMKYTAALHRARRHKKNGLPWNPFIQSPVDQAT
jgi:hypothetical protein